MDFPFPSAEIFQALVQMSSFQQIPFLTPPGKNRTHRTNFPMQLSYSNSYCLYTYLLSGMKATEG